MLNSYQSNIVKLILRKFDDTQVDNFSNEEMWNAFDNILSDFITTIEGNKNDLTNPAAYLINLVCSCFFFSFMRLIYVIICISENLFS